MRCSKLGITYILSLVLMLLVQQTQAQQCNIIYITPTGSGAGTKASPASLAGGAALATPGAQLWLAAGNYTISAPISLQNNMVIEGGFDPTNNWRKSNTLTTTIFRDNTNPQPAPDRIVAIEGINVGGFVLQDLTIRTADAVGNGVTTYGVYLSACNVFDVTRCNIFAGNGSNGLPGTPGVNGIPGANGAIGNRGDEDGSCCTNGGAGGSGSYPGSSAGGNGGNGGARGTYSFPVGGNAPAGSAGQNGLGTTPGTGGTAGNGYCSVISLGCDAGPANWGQPGTDGTNGANGTNGAAGIPTYATGFFQNGDGQNGVNGENGSGGGGGGGGGSQGCVAFGFFISNSNGSGAGGGGGAEGGQGGFGALGGRGGGGSFGLFSWATGVNANIKDTYTNSGIPGQGGIGGAPGGLGAPGGIGGFGGGTGNGGQPFACDIGRGGNGGNGGQGGNGGTGGNGSIGFALPLWEDPNAPVLNQSDQRTPVEPTIFVVNTGCTYSDITVSTNATGIIQWFFDGGTVPLTAVGQSVTIQYTTLGRHTITMVRNGVPYVFTDFVGIFSNGLPFVPDIIASNDSVCLGGTIDFSSSYAGIDYSWTMEGTVPTTYNGPGFQNVNGVTFNTLGTYKITLQTTSPCCGKSKIDTLEIKVVPFVNADVFTFASATTICDGETVNFGASPVNGGASPTYQWTLNNTNVGTGNTYSSSTLNNGDQVEVVMTSTFLCVNNNPATSLPITITVNPQPTVNCAFVGQFLGAPTNFTANPVGVAPFTYSWEFGDGGTSTLQNPAHNYGATGTFTATLTVTDANGCQASCSQQVNMSIAPEVNALFTGNIISQTCGNATVDFTDNSNGGVIGWFWDFGDNTTSALQNPSHTYTNPGYYDVTLVATNGVLADTLVLPNFIYIAPPAQALFTTVDSIECQPYEFQFVDKSLGGATSWLWDFGDGTGVTSALQNPRYTYAVPGTYSVTLTVTNQDGCTSTTTLNNYIQYLPQPEAGFSTTDTLVCTTNKVLIVDESIQGDKWFYNMGDGTIVEGTPDAEHVYTKPGVYTVTQYVESVLGCKDSLRKDLLITVVPYPEAIFTSDEQDFILQMPDTAIQFFNQSLYYDSLFWNFGIATAYNVEDTIIVYQDTGVYAIRLFAVNALGCVDTLIIPLTVREQESFFVSNSFTPDDDFNNETWPVIGKGITSGQMLIFNRWGEVIFNTDKIFEGWDGRLANGTPAMNGVYTYRINITWFTGRTFEKTGTVSLVR